MRFRSLWRAVLPLSMIGCTSMATAQTGVPRSKAARPTLSTLLSRNVPQRDLYALTNALRLHPPRAIPHTIRTHSPNYPVGRTDDFYVLSDDTSRYFTMHATIVTETPHLYLYVQNGVKVNLVAAQQAAQHFERVTRPTDRSYFGSEWMPGVDGDPHITLLLGDLKSSAATGFFSAEDEYPHLVNPFSNQREMIYMNSTATVPGDNGFNRTVAHEFQHMIHWHMHPHDNAWLNEGMSMLAEYLNGFTPNDEASIYLSLPTTQLDSWSLTGNETLAHYGGAYLFLLYLYQQYGRGFIKDMLAANPYTDMEAINHVLQERHIPTTADALVARWVASLAGARLGIADAYTRHVAGRLTPTRMLTAPFVLKQTVPPYAPQYFLLDTLQNVQPFSLHFQGASVIPVVSAPNGGPMWWSNRGDMSDMQLVRSVDLTHVKGAALHYQAWYDIEKGFDYAYVEASTDGGTTWSTLRGTDTTSLNPNGASFGQAYTGASNGWRDETVDLSAYAGHTIKLRFEYVTDDEYNGEGLLIRHLTIPAIHFTDRFTGWSRRGWVPIKRNALPGRWNVQVIEDTTTGLHVKSMQLRGGTAGTLQIDPTRDGIRRLMVSVFAMAPRSTVRVGYQLRAAYP